MKCIMELNRVEICIYCFMFCVLSLYFYGFYVFFGRANACFHESDCVGCMTCRDNTCVDYRIGKPCFSKTVENDVSLYYEFYYGMSTDLINMRCNEGHFSAIISNSKRPVRNLTQKEYQSTSMFLTKRTDKCNDMYWSYGTFDKKPILKTVIVTGAAGYIGSHTSLKLLEAGYNVVAIDNLSRGSRKALEILQSFPNFYFFNIDLGNIEAVDRVLRQNKEAISVFHFAAVAFTLESVEFPELYKLNITLNTQILVNTMIRYKIPHLIYSSSCSVYGSPTKFPITEETNAIPVSPYGVAKLNAEKYIQKQAIAGNIRAHLLRYFNVVGADPKGRLRENPRSNLAKYARLWTATVDTIFKRRKCVTLYDSTLDTADGTAIRDYVHVSDLANAHLSVLKYGFKNPVDIWNVGTGTGVSTKEFIQAAKEVSGKDIPICLETRKKIHSPPKLYASSKKLTDATGWKPTYTDIKDSLKTAWDVESM